MTRNRKGTSITHLSLLCAPILVAIVSLPPTGPAPSLVHQWDFETDGVVNDVGSSAAKNGTLIGGATVTGGVLQLNGSTGYVQFDARLIPTSPSYTVALFARADGAANTGASRDFISQGAAGGAFYIGVALSGRSIRAGDNWPDVASAAFIADGQYHHYALTMSASGASFYVDGAPVAENAPFAGGSGGTATRLGRGVGDAGMHFSGYLDDVRIYDEALSDEQIQEIARNVPRLPNGNYAPL